MVLVEASQVLVQDASHGYILPLFHYFIWAAFNWYPWALLTPFIFDLAKQYPFTRFNWAERIFFPHVIACCACLVVHGMLLAACGWAYTLNHEMRTPFMEFIQKDVEGRLLLNLASYASIVGVSALFRLRDEVRQSKLSQAQLEARLASAELEKLRMQLQPHFLFNTLQAAITLVQENSSAAEDVLLRLSELLRITFDQMDTNEVSLARELEFLDLYVGIQQQRFKDRLKIEIHAEPSTLELQVPPLLLQPLVENAIRHGIGKHKGEDTIEVFARYVDGGLQLEVWNHNSVIEESSDQLFLRGVGLRNTRARLEHLYGPRASLIVRGLSRGGAAAILFIPKASQAGGTSQKMDVRW